MPTPWDEWIADQIRRTKERNLLRSLQPLTPTGSPVKALIGAEALSAWLSGDAFRTPSGRSEPCGRTELTLFSVNDYLGLSSHPDVTAAAARAARAAGMGRRASALISGHSTSHAELEGVLAELKGTEECLLFPTGYAANMGVMTGLCSQQKVHIFSDEYNHASIVDGCRLASKAGAKLNIYRHNNMSHLDSLLSACPSGVRKLVVTDGLFSMDGDFADLMGLTALRRRHKFLLAVDEAHSTLVCGRRGAGACELQGVADQVDLHIGTLSKAVGAQGGFVCCSHMTKQLLVSKARSQIYSTALPLPVVAAALEAVRVSYREWWRRRHLWRLVELAGSVLGAAAQSPILPLVVGSEQEALDFSRQLLEAGLHVPAIRPPTVPQGMCRLRLTLSAAHSFEDVGKLVQAIHVSGREFRGIDTGLGPRAKL